MGGMDETLPAPDGTVDAEDRAHLLALFGRTRIRWRDVAFSDWRLRDAEDVRGLRQAIQRQSQINQDIKSLLQSILGRLDAGGL